MNKEASINNNVIWQYAHVTRNDRMRMHRHKSVLLWFTGLSNSGKSTIAHAVEERLFEIGCHTYVFDGDNVRHGLCSDLGFSKEDRIENIRRIGEMTKLFIEAGIIALTAFISPYRNDREKVRKLVGDENFIEIYCKCPIEICEQRDVKGHYKQARAGKINDFTGVSSPYEEPFDPEVILDSANCSVDENVDIIITFLTEKGVINNPDL